MSPSPQKLMQQSIYLMWLSAKYLLHKAKNQNQKQAQMVSGWKKTIVVETIHMNWTAMEATKMDYILGKSCAFPPFGDFYIFLYFSVALSLSLSSN